MEYEVPPVRVCNWNYETDEQEIGTVIDMTKLFYVVIPDYNTQLTKMWRKIDCDIIR